MRVAVIYGGPSGEHQVSIDSGRQVVAALETQRSVTPVVIGHDLRWRFSDNETLSVGMALDRLVSSVDVVFPALHGPFGEDGMIQALLDAVHLPYVGSDTQASALAMHKAATKDAYVRVGLPTPRSGFFRSHDKPKLSSILSKLFPCVVKPANFGSSVGIELPTTETEAIEKVTNLLDQGVDVLVEEVISGREFTCGVLEEADGPVALPVTEIIPAEHYRFFDYEAKYTPGATSEVTPAEIDTELSTKIQKMAVAAHLCLGCRDLSRTDFMLKDGGPMLLETNTLPGMTSISLFPQAAAAAGISFESLMIRLVDRAYKRGPRTQW